MTGFTKYILSLMLSLPLMLSAAGKVYTVDEVPDVHRYDARAYVSDPQGILSQAARSRLNATAAQLEQTTGVETAIVVLPSIGNDTPEDFTVRLFGKWGVGKKGKDLGLMILLVTEDRYIRFETGYGLEGVLTDAMSKRIQTRRMNPLLASGDWDGGMISGLDAVRELLTDPSSELLADLQNEDVASFYRGLLFILFGLGLVILASVVAYRRSRKCPRCGAQMRQQNETASRVAPGVRMVTTVLVCPRCGNVVTRTRRENIAPAVTGGTIGGLGGLGGLGRGGGVGWGGGRSGGGGATSRF